MRSRKQLFGLTVIREYHRVESHRQKRGVEKPGRFFNEYGAPVPGASVEKPRRFFNTRAAVERS